jgi:hypothetical protein
MLTGIFHAAALHSMQCELLINFVTAVTHLTADPLFSACRLEESTTAHGQLY